MIYSSLPAEKDLGFVRFAGAGMGNCFYAYFHAFALARETAQRMIAPAWADVRVGPFLRRERTMRRYAGMFRRHPDEIGGWAKMRAITRGWRTRRVQTIRPGARLSDAGDAALTVVRVGECCFNELGAHRAAIRERLIEIMASPPAAAPAWGRQAYVAVHVRMGDFAVSTSPADLRATNTRVPMAWYEGVIGRLRTVYPELPIELCSDGTEKELAPLLRMPGIRLRRCASDIDELLVMAQAQLFVGSNSTFSFWAAFLGDMPSIWPAGLQEAPGDAATPLLCVGYDFERIDRTALTAG